MVLLGLHGVENLIGAMKEGCSGASLSRYPLLCSLTSMNENLQSHME